MCTRSLRFEMVTEMKVSSITSAVTDGDSRHLGHILNLMNDRCDTYQYMVPVIKLDWNDRSGRYVFFRIDSRFATEISILDDMFRDIVEKTSSRIGLDWKTEDIKTHYRSPFRIMNDGAFFIKINSRDVDVKSIRAMREERWAITLQFDYIFVSRICKVINVGKTVLCFSAVEGSIPPVDCMASLSLNKITV